MIGFENWKMRNSEFSKALKDLNKAFDEERSIMEDTIRRICEENGLPVRSVDGSSDNSEFLVRFDGDTSNQIQFSRKFLVDIGMGFVVRRVLNEEANNELLLELYPFGDEEL